MKKILTILLLSFCILFVTGCEKKTEESKKEESIIDSIKTMTCNREEVDEDGYKISEKINITYNSKKVLKTETTIISEVDPEMLDFELAVINYISKQINEVNGINIKNEKLSDNELIGTRVVDYEIVNPEEVQTKYEELFNESVDLNEFYIYRDYNTTIDQYKEEFLSEFNCN